LPYIYKPKNHQHPYRGHVNDSLIRTYMAYSNGNGNGIVSRQTYGNVKGKGNGVRTLFWPEANTAQYFASINPLSHHGSLLYQTLFHGCLSKNLFNNQCLRNVETKRKSQSKFKYKCFKYHRIWNVLFENWSCPCPNHQPVIEWKIKKLVSHHKLWKRTFF
jgi:hypothetical protein